MYLPECGDKCGLEAGGERGTVRAQEHLDTQPQGSWHLAREDPHAAFWSPARPRVAEDTSGSPRTLWALGPRDSAIQTPEGAASGLKAQLCAWAFPAGQAAASLDQPEFLPAHPAQPSHCDEAPPLDSPYPCLLLSPPCHRSEPPTPGWGPSGAGGRGVRSTPSRGCLALGWVRSPRASFLTLAECTRASLSCYESPQCVSATKPRHARSGDVNK